VNKRPAEVLTIAEVAVLLRISKRTAYRLLRTGRLPGKKVGGSWRFLRSKVLDALKIEGDENG
jgi:excisionase family DNA binding protein